MRNQDVRAGRQFISFVGNLSCEDAFEHVICFVGVDVAMIPGLVTGHFHQLDNRPRTVGIFARCEVPDGTRIVWQADGFTGF
jgi:hypothetical protein